MQNQSHRDVVPVHSSDTTPLLQQGTNHLLVIGIDAYQHMGHLSNCVEDAKAFMDVLTTDYGFEQERVMSLFNEEATKENILEAFDHLSRSLPTEDNLIIYFAGHGYYVKPTKMGFLVPVDGKKGKNSSLVYNSVIRDYIRGIPAHHIFLVVDSCFSGDLIMRSRGEGDDLMATEAYAERVDHQPSRWGLAAGRIEKVADGLVGNHSPFNTSLVNFLTRHPSKQFAVSELINHVARMVTYNADQTPIGGILNHTGHQGGEFVFRKKVDEVGQWKDFSRQHTISAYQHYLHQFPTGRFREEAQRKLMILKDEGAWKDAVQRNTIRAYYQYRDQFPQGKHAEEALKRIEVLEEERDWEEATKVDRISAYERYKNRYRKGKYVTEANEGIARILAKEAEPAAWRKAKEENTIAAYENFLKDYPHGPFAASARSEIYRIESEINKRQQQQEEEAKREEARRQRQKREEERKKRIQEQFLKAKALQQQEKYQEAKNALSQLNIVDSDKEAREIKALIHQLDNELQFSAFHQQAEKALGQKDYSRAKKLIKQALSFPSEHTANAEAFLEHLNQTSFPWWKRTAVPFVGVGVIILMFIFGIRIFYQNDTGGESNSSSEYPSITTDSGNKVIVEEVGRIKKIPVEMVPVKGSTFYMGSEDRDKDEQPIHKVALSNFEIGKHEVTQAQWEEVMGVNPSRVRGDLLSSCPNCPVENVSWNDVQEFIEKLNEKYPGKNYRLPTEAEWEYAARGGNESKGNLYSGSSELGSVGWFYDNSNNKTHPVGKKQPNELGIYDMSGNVYEWCHDWYDNEYYKTCAEQGTITNPKGPNSGVDRVLRGGSWYDGASNCRVAVRLNGHPDFRYNRIGFRLARTVP